MARKRTKPRVDTRLYDTDVAYHSLPESNRLSLQVGDTFRYFHARLGVQLYIVCQRDMTDEEKKLYADKMTRDYVEALLLADTHPELFYAKRAILMPCKQSPTGLRLCATGLAATFRRSDKNIDPVTVQDLEREYHPERQSVERTNIETRQKRDARKQLRESMLEQYGVDTEQTQPRKHTPRLGDRYFQGTNIVHA